MKRNIFERLATTPVRWVILVFTAVFLFLRWLISRPTGILIGTILAYFLLFRVTAFKPLSPGEMLLWLASEPRDVTIAITTALLTIVGFVVAFSIAQSAWKSQRRTEIRLAASDEIYGFFQEAWDHLLTLGLYCDSLSEFHEMLHGSTADPALIAVKSQRILDSTQKFHQSRHRLSRMSIEVHSLRAKHEIVLSNQWFGIKLFQSALGSLELVVSAMWITAPVSIDDAQKLFAFVVSFDRAEWDSLSRIVDESRAKGMAATGALRGMMISDVIKPSAATFFHLRWSTKQLTKLVRESSSSS